MFNIFYQSYPDNISVLHRWKLKSFTPQQVVTNLISDIEKLSSDLIKDLPESTRREKTQALKEKKEELEKVKEENNIQ